MQVNTHGLHGLLQLLHHRFLAGQVMDTIGVQHLLEYFSFSQLFFLLPHFLEVEIRPRFLVLFRTHLRFCFVRFRDVVGLSIALRLSYLVLFIIIL